MINKIIHFFYSLYNPYPCGRTKENKYLCCRRKTNKFNTYLNKDKTELRCRFCNNIKIMSNCSINQDDPYGWVDINEYYKEN